MSEHVVAPFMIRWFAAVLQTIPGPSREWADIVGHLAWPGVVLYLVTRYRSFLRSLLTTLVDRFHTDDVKLGPFEIRANDQVLVLDPNPSQRSGLGEFPGDVNRIERMFEFIAEDEGFLRLHDWMERNFGTEAVFRDFLTEPCYANAREQAFKQVEGLAV